MALNGSWAAGAFALALVACSNDDACQRGAALGNPRIAGPLLTSARGVLLRIAWDPGSGRGAELPESYFAAAKVNEQRDVGPDGPAIDTNVTVRGREMELIVLSVRESLSGALRFRIDFPDRKRFITCEDGSSTGPYGLSADLTLANGTVTQSTLTEIRPAED